MVVDNENPINNVFATKYSKHNMPDTNNLLRDISIAYSFNFLYT